MRALAFMTLAGWTLCQPLTAASALASDPRPQRGVVTHAFGYDPWAVVPAAPKRSPGGKAAAPARGSTPTVVPTAVEIGSCLLAKGTVTSIECKPLPRGGDGPSPEVLAQRAVAHLVLPSPVIRTAPPRKHDGLVGLPEFFWADRAHWRPRTQRASAGGVWAEVAATPSRLNIRPGDGEVLSCDGPGTPYDLSRAPAGQDHTCTYTYQRSSAGLPHSAYRVTAEVVWKATWVGSGGVGGELPSLTRSSGFRLRIAEAQALTTH
ncbi:hypothetical protein DZF91_12980 [Actinomadura logoneensis]|uniref:ATP/GTP-binding protein n=1 Tax=Actinomadura logoneensis TaxID=2293572 RepID=A0A372JMF8_9ACTN|nr:hypothetical protein [Actinomadura logoneensis]RFU41192.1 hypothetical protein DZF91_12980 [Actinomadura logoneensis]